MSQVATQPLESTTENHNRQNLTCQTGAVQVGEAPTCTGVARLVQDRAARLTRVLGVQEGDGSGDKQQGRVWWVIARTSWVRGEAFQRSLLAHLLRWLVAAVLRRAGRAQPKGSRCRGLARLHGQLLRFVAGEGSAEQWDKRARWWFDASIDESERNTARPWSIAVTDLGAHLADAAVAILRADADAFARALRGAHNVSKYILRHPDLRARGARPQLEPDDELADRADEAFWHEFAWDVVALLDHHADAVWVHLERNPIFVRVTSRELETSDWDFAARHVEAVAVASAWCPEHLASPPLSLVEQARRGLERTRGCALELHALHLLRISPFSEKVVELRSSGALWPYLARVDWARALAEAPRRVDGESFRRAIDEALGHAPTEPPAAVEVAS